MPALHPRRPALYNLWREMRYRCHRPTHKNFSSYGARGITVCDRWRDSYTAFAADVGSRPPGYTLERIDNERGYEPGNVRWASRREQQQNTRQTRAVIDSDGNEYPTIGAAARAHGLHRSVIDQVCRGARRTAAGLGWKFATLQVPEDRRQSLSADSQDDANGGGR